MNEGGIQFATVQYDGVAVELEYAWLAMDNPGPLVVFLHEGLGSLRMWRDFPSQFCNQLTCRGLVYSRAGYGQSSSLWRGSPWPREFMHVEAEHVLPRFLRAVGLTDACRPILFGHSDGASVALLYAAKFPAAVAGLILEAPHIFVEPLTIANIEQTKAQYLESDLASRLAKYHRDAAAVFEGWSGVWLSPAFRTWNIEAQVSSITCPILAIQGLDDQYGTMEQLDRLNRLTPRVTQARLAQCRHSPHQDQRASVIEQCRSFITSPPVSRRHPAGSFPR
jgi:pimeloyl-ACP methyl ester carboxylesterase